MGEIRQPLQITNADGSGSGLWRMTMRTTTTQPEPIGCCECAGAIADCPGHETAEAASAAYHRWSTDSWEVARRKHEREEAIAALGRDVFRVLRANDCDYTPFAAWRRWYGEAARIDRELPANGLPVR